MDDPNKRPAPGSRSNMVSAVKEAVGGALGLAMAATSITRPQFIRLAIIANLYEIEAAKIALQRALRTDVIDFARTMLVDHEEIGSKLRSFIGGTNSPQMPPDELDALHQTLIDDLHGASDEAFDRRYIAQQKIAHAEALTLLKTYHRTARDDGLRSLIGLALPVFEQHKQMLRQLDQAGSEAERVG